MSELLPQGWKLQPLRNLAQIVSGGTPSRYAPEFWDKGMIPWATPTDITGSSGRYLTETREHITERGLRSCSARLLPPGSLLMTSRATLGEVRIAASEVCTNQGFKSLIPFKGVDRHFLFYQIRLNKEQYKGFGIGSTFLEVSKRDTERFEVLVAPEYEQRRIAEILSTLDDTIEQTETLISKYLQIKAGLMHDLFTRGVSPDGCLRPARNQAPYLYKESPLGWIPKEWEVRLLVNAVSQKPNAIVDGPFGSNLKTIHYRTSGIPVIQSGYVTSGLFEANQYQYVTEAHFHTQSRSKVSPGDIVMAKIGAQAGMCAVLPDDHIFGILAGNSLKISADNSILQRDWLVAYLHRLYAITGMSQLRTETAQPAISIGRLKKLSVPVPNLPEQIIGTKTLTAINESLVQQNSVLQKTVGLKHGLMHDLLTGRVRVNVCEPAAA